MSIASKRSSDERKRSWIAAEATIADVAEAHYRRVQAEVDLKLNQRERSDIDSILRRLSDLERKVKELQDANRERRLVENQLGTQRLAATGNPSSAIM